MSCSMLCSPPCCTMERAFSAIDCGIESPDRSSSAAGRFSDANTLMERTTIFTTFQKKKMVLTHGIVLRAKI